MRWSFAVGGQPGRAIQLAYRPEPTARVLLLDSHFATVLLGGCQERIEKMLGGIGIPSMAES